MKKIVLALGTAAILMTGTAEAQSSHSYSSTTYSTAGNNYGLGNNATYNGTEVGPGNVTQSEAAAIYATIPASDANKGSVFSQSSTAPNNTEAESATVANAFTLSGNVTKDCSFYGGGQTNHTIALGTIGVRTGNNDNVSIAFNQREAITANVNSATAGCNTKNTVTIEKANGSDGLLNKSAGNYDTAQFTNKIPYSVKASWTGAGDATANGSAQYLTVASGDGTGSKSGGAWRSAFNMDINAPAQSLGLVAGDYSDTITVTLTAG